MKSASPSSSEGSSFERGSRNGKIDSIEISLKSDMVCSNPNRVAILNLLKKSPNREMQAEKIAQSIGVSHRTVLYHLDVLHDYELVEVRSFRRKGKKMLRSIWGLNAENTQMEKVLVRVAKRFPEERIRKILRANGQTNGYAR
jgi:DNA-binding transcriptional ArsR family regulator